MRAAGADAATGATSTAPPVCTLANLDLSCSISSSTDFPLSSLKTFLIFSVSDSIPTELRIFTMSAELYHPTQPKV
ncbi:hypothetical protein WA026_015163 [Henosepilachna vigintioctopunctata]|uniref:Uncharacterized protein n=1 Tax=Henosepilachna vigintioctopunctata TaxID=420089 RepID=A0AAW1TNL7_9CUCU